MLIDSLCSRFKIRGVSQTISSALKNICLSIRLFVVRGSGGIWELGVWSSFLNIQGAQVAHARGILMFMMPWLAQLAIRDYHQLPVRYHLVLYAVLKSKKKSPYPYSLISTSRHRLALGFKNDIVLLSFPARGGLSQCL